VLDEGNSIIQTKVKHPEQKKGNDQTRDKTTILSQPSNFSLFNETQLSNNSIPIEKELGHESIGDLKKLLWPGPLAKSLHPS
jgi:hypothetical protein